MLQNLTNFFNLITNRKIKTTLKPNDLIAVGTRDSTWVGNYQPTAISFENLEAQIAASVTPATPTLQDVVNESNGLSNFGGIGTASISSINFVNNRSLYLNNNANPTIRIVDNLNASNNLQIDIDTLTLDGISYNWSSIVAGGSVPSWLESNATDLTIWNNGKGNIPSNTSYGESALKNNVTGINNTAIGSDTLTSCFTNSSNIAIGTQALQNTNGSLANGNVGIGNVALRNNTTGSQNTALGSSALTSNTTGIDNVVVGAGAASVLTTGSNNTVIGTQATPINFSGSVILGKGATASGSNQFVVGTGSVNAGIVFTEVLSTFNHSWTVRINGANYKIPLLSIP